MVWGTKTRQERGYGAAWERLRKLVIQRDGGLCQQCKRENRLSLGKDVDHIVSKAKATRLGWSKEKTDAMSNLEFLCRSCHLKKTEEEQGKTKKKTVAYGEDGWPIEKA